MAEDFERNSRVISALKRLERAGAEQSLQGQKLIEAAGTLASEIAVLLPRYEQLPRGYVVVRSVVRPGLERLHVQNHAGAIWTVDENRGCALAFARDIATGLLDELADWLETRGAESAEAAAKLQVAAEAVR